MKSLPHRQNSGALISSFVQYDVRYSTVFWGGYDALGNVTGMRQAPNTYVEWWSFGETEDSAGKHSRLPSLYRDEKLGLDGFETAT